MSLCEFENFYLCNPQVDKGEALSTALEIGEALGASPYDLIGLAIAFGADPLEAKKKLALEITGHIKKPVAAFLAKYGRVHGYERVERELLRLYQAQRGGCICPVGPLAPWGGGYIVQRAVRSVHMRRRRLQRGSAGSPWPYTSTPRAVCSTTRRWF
jgi:hypothetical protein